MKRTDKKTVDTEKRKSPKNPKKSNCYPYQIFANIKNLNHQIKLCLTRHPIIKNTLVFISSFVFTFFVYFLVQTRSIFFF